MTLQYADFNKYVAFEYDISTKLNKELRSEHTTVIPTNAQVAHVNEFSVERVCSLFKVNNFRIFLFTCRST